jgi:hypothetical protein
MNSGTQAAKEAGNKVDLDSNPTKLIEIVRIGEQLLMTRGALKTFSIANDVAKYFAIISAAFAATYPELAVLNIMGLATPTSAVRSATHLQRTDHHRPHPARTEGLQLPRCLRPPRRLPGLILVFSRAANPPRPSQRRRTGQSSFELSRRWW